jgi:hypothetical protein
MKILNYEFIKTKKIKKRVKKYLSRIKLLLLFNKKRIGYKKTKICFY